ncbi:hypothetical protein P153DRAFT_369983 [Dothidotthia symphoricarpi CBS 119687]|uniref:BZIP domain-containing protein n=1 Tax=Dothidotthia symphoricarpi CBS 119687 TaxID=1392245 RepID=A0A6A6A3H4_9PLEO|nr:uncharacterized protein P153DRAFT_369983 [Dothidotthia symphoricarpi CBS 119687]KAF2125308.1 hypothetical protein P153DRAFT_369983 [Dothidotthia symphoricarpi CBS 119687]
MLGGPLPPLTPPDYEGNQTFQLGGPSQSQSQSQVQSQVQQQLQPQLQPQPQSTLVPHVTANPDQRLTARSLVARTLPSTHLSQQGSSATASSKQALAGPSSGGGPTGKSYVVPPRPKPGRKPATDEPASKRKAQNRESQRAFRLRKMATVAALKEEVTELKDAVREQQEQTNYWHNRCMELEQREKERGLASHSQQQSSPMITMPFPNSSVHEARQEDSPSFAYNTPKTEIPDGCGKCKPNGECPCISDIANQVTLDDDYEPAVALPARSTTKKTQTTAQTTAQTTTQTPQAFSEVEMDFTSRSAAQQPYPDPRASINFMLDNEHESCGFCTDISNCACRDLAASAAAGESAPDPMQGTSSYSAMELDAAGIITTLGNSRK